MNNHDLYKLALHDKKQYPTIAIGSAGTGKTYGAVEAALDQLLHRKVERIICTRPNVSFADKNGFLPGTEREKMDPWVRPIIQHIDNIMKQGIDLKGVKEKISADYLEREHRLLFYPLEYIQGMTFDRSFIILDECQNMSFEQLKVFLTRVGKWSKVVLCGDIAQVSPQFKNSGLAELLKMVDYSQIPVHVIEFTHEDILRSEQCKQWIIGFEAWENRKNG